MFCKVHYFLIYFVLDLQPDTFFIDTNWPHPLTVGRVGLSSDDTLVDQINITPVVALSAFAINSSGGVGDGSPEGTSCNILLPCVTLSIKDCLTTSKSVVVHGLQTPFSNEDRELGLLSNVGSLSTDSGVDILRVSASCGEVVNVRV